MISTRLGDAPRHSLRTPTIFAYGIMLLLAGIFLLAALASGTVWKLDSARLFAFAKSLQQTADRPPLFSPAEIRALQSRAAIATFLYAGLFAVTLRYAVPILLAVGRDLPSLLRPLRSLPRSDRAVILFGMLIVTTLVTIYANQPMRLDESASFLKYGIRPVIVGLAFYESTNNHVLYSVLMRGAVAVLGTAPWALRLPAMIATILIVPAGYFATRRMFDRGSAWLTTLLLASAVYTIDIGTNARGYAILNLAFLSSIALLPQVRQSRPAAVAVFVLLNALGAFAVPMMIYPFAICLVWILVADLLRHDDWLPIIRKVLILVAATILLTGTLYLPALLVTGWEAAGIRAAVESAGRPSLETRVTTMLLNAGNAWQQWTFPLATIAGYGTMIVAGCGLLTALRGSLRSRALVVAMFTGTFFVWILSGMVALPWWALTFLFPFYVMLFAVGVTTLLQIVIPGRSQYTANIVAICGGLGGVALIAFAAYPAAFPHYMGFRNAKSVANVIIEDATDDLIFSEGTAHKCINYYLYRSRSPRRVLPDPPATYIPPDRLIHIDPLLAPSFGFRQRLDENDYRVIREVELSECTIRWYFVD